MAWVAVEINGDEYIFSNKPKRDRNFWFDEVYESFDGQGGRLEHSHYSDIQLPKGSVKKLIGKDLTWEDNPVELEEE